MKIRKNLPKATSLSWTKNIIRQLFWSTSQKLMVSYHLIYNWHEHEWYNENSRRPVYKIHVKGVHTP